MVHRDMVERKGSRTVAIEYEMKGFGIAFLAGLGLLVAGILQKKEEMTIRGQAWPEPLGQLKK